MPILPAKRAIVSTKQWVKKSRPLNMTVYDRLWPKTAFIVPAAVVRSSL
jgi:hypothetical protein